MIKNAAIKPALTPNKHNCTEVFGFANRRLSCSSHMLYSPPHFFSEQFSKRAQVSPCDFAILVTNINKYYSVSLNAICFGTA